MHQTKLFFLYPIVKVWSTAGKSVEFGKILPTSKNYPPSIHLPFALFIYFIFLLLAFLSFLVPSFATVPIAFKFWNLPD